jgi:phosphatidate cytidylyltransferase
LADARDASGASVLKLRVITALIAAPTVIAAIFLLPSTAFAAVFLVLAALGLYEWAQLCGITGRVWQALYLAGFAGLGFALLQAPAVWPICFAVVAGFWLCAAVIVMTYPRSASLLRRGVLVVAGYLVLLGTWLGFVALNHQPAGAWLILWTFVIVWSADIGGYFVGRQFGQRRLAVQVSPGKTWEGALGGVFAAAVIGTLFGAGIPALAGVGFEISQWLLAAILLAVVSIFGDLFESALKRARGVKDSGTLFPGHGGMLDRIDALMAALPCFAFVVAQQP